MLVVRRRRGGERLRPQRRARTMTLQHLCQSLGVLPWMRDALPLLYAGEDLIAVGATLGKDEYREVIENAPAGIFDPRSWAYWNLVCGIVPALPIPNRSDRLTNTVPVPVNR